MITLFNIISVCVLVAVVIVAVIAYRRFRKSVEDADGFGELNERGEIGTSDEGDIVGKV